VTPAQEAPPDGAHANAAVYAASALQERVKELTCLYGISQLSERFDGCIEKILQGVAELIPAGWQYPDIARARITIDGCSYSTAGFSPGPQRQAAAIVADGRPRGSVEIVYTELRPERDEGPFLGEERSLLDEVAAKIGLIIERHQGKDERSRLQTQLLHADRLATIGQLAAGVAHELNEPLSGILGFAQLARKHPNVPAHAADDIQKIVNACLHAREVIKRLLLFARQGPRARSRLSLNEIIAGALDLFEHHLKKEAITLVTELDPYLPKIEGDPGQLTQVLVNLVTNAIQAMPQGGTLTIRTAAGAGDVVCVVDDTGVGMGEDVRSRIFDPFFTTKDVDHGTGLGLPVAHGIVAAHGGTIAAESDPGRGTRFTIRLPIEEPGE